MSASSGAALQEFIVDRLQVGVFVVDSRLEVVLWNHFMSVHSGKPAAEVVGRNLLEVFPELPRSWLEKKIAGVFVLGNYAFTSWEQRPYLFRFQDSRPVTGGLDCMRQSCTFLPVKDASGAVQYVCVTLTDYTDTALYQQQLSTAIVELQAEKAEQRELIGKLDEAHNQLLQAEKLAGIGQLAAGVAHEINNPIGFVSSNLITLERYVGGLLQLVDAYDAAGAASSAPTPAAAQIEALKQSIDLPYLREDLGDLIRESKDGLERVKKIVGDLKDFTRLGETSWQWSDLHQCLDTTLNVVWNELKYKAEIVKEYGSPPQVQCIPSQLNQVFMNLLVNAAQAIPERGKIVIQTGSEGPTAWVSISDTGGGIKLEHLNKIFDPFFTTKPVGKGTGLGLSVSYSIVSRHGGKIEVESEIGTGTTFRVCLPIKQPEPVEA